MTTNDKAIKVAELKPGEAGKGIMVWGKKVSVANMLPSLLLAVAAAYLPWTF